MTIPSKYLPECLVKDVGEAGAHVLGRALHEERPQDVEAAALRGRLRGQVREDGLGGGARSLH